MMKKNISVVAGIVFLVGLVLALVFLTLRKTNGVFSYPVDDTFIHMAVAKNQALHGNWGINPDEWVSTSSSPFFTALLALCYKIAGLNVYTDRKSTRLNSSHSQISYAVFCLKKKKTIKQ